MTKNINADYHIGNGREQNGPIQRNSDGRDYYIDKQGKAHVAEVDHNYTPGQQGGNQQSSFSGNGGPDTSSDRFATWSLVFMFKTVLRLLGLAFRFWQISLAAIAGLLTFISFNNHDITNGLLFALIAIAAISFYVYQLSHRNK